MSSSNERIQSISLDHKTQHMSLEAEHERVVAMNDLVHENRFEALCMLSGPYDVKLSIRDGRLNFDIHASATDKSTTLALSMQPLRGLVRDYFMICESYFEAIKAGGASKIEAIDMARRGIHNEGGEALIAMLDGRIRIDHPTARRLFTLICALHLK